MTVTFSFALLTSGAAAVVTGETDAFDEGLDAAEEDGLEAVEDDDGVVGLPAGLTAPAGDFLERSGETEALREERAAEDIDGEREVRGGRRCERE